MVKVNLLPKENLEKQPIGKFLKWTLSYGRYIIISVELVVFLVFFSRFIFDQQLADLNDQVEQKQAIVVAAGEFEGQIRNIQDRIEEVKKIDTNRGLYLDILNILKNTTPVEITFTNISFSREELSITGEALTNESFAKLLTSLKSDSAFSEITLVSLGKKISAAAESTDKNKIVSFTISAIIAGYPTPTPTMSISTKEEVSDESN